MELLKDLNPEQLEGVTHEAGPLLIVAGAGTGKTTVITRRIAWLILEKRVKPDEILALTFTEKAAGEMAERVDHCLPYGYVDLWISTFHSFCEQILREHGLEIGIPNEFKLLNQTEQWLLVKKNLEKFDLEYYRPLGNPTKFIHALLRHFSRAKDELVTPEEYLKYAEELQANQDSMEGTGGTLKKKKSEILNPKSETNHKFKIPNSKQAASTENNEVVEEIDPVKTMEIAKAYHTYQRLLLDSGAFDFGDLINYTHQLFVKRPVILKKYQHQFKYVLVDEFQDTNYAQYEIVKMLAGDERNLTVVADDDQSIYRFRGASMSNILLFKKDFPEARQILLTKNYRTKQNILDAAYQFIQLNNPNRLEVQLANQSSSAKATADRRVEDANLRGGLSKKLEAQRKGEGVYEVLHYPDEQAEVRDIVKRIVAAGSQDGAWDKYAILVRSNAQAASFEQALYEAGIPYQFMASKGLYTKRVVLDTVNYLKLLDNYHESPSVWRVLSMPLWGFVHADLVKLSHQAKKKNHSLFSVFSSEISELTWAKESLGARERLLQMVRKHAEETKRLSVSKVILNFLNDSGYLKYLTQDSNQREDVGAVAFSSARVEAQHIVPLRTEVNPAPTERDQQLRLAEISYLNQFFKKVKSFEASVQDPSVRNFLELVDLEFDSGEEGSLAQEADTGPETVKIMTIHGAKGLEFGTVFIPQLVDKRFPSVSRGEPIELPEALIRDILSKGDFHLEEERRLMYVAMTRAKDSLYLSYADDYGGATKKKPSRFLYELGIVEKSESRKVHKVESRKEDVISSEGVAEVEKFHNGSLHVYDGISPFASAVRSPNESAGRDDKSGGNILPTKFSFTQIKAFSTCPYQYRFAHILKIPTKGSGMFSFGQSLHVTLQKFFENYLKGGEKEQGDLFGASSVGAGLASAQVGAQHLVPLRAEVNPAPTKRIPSFDDLLQLLEESWISDWYDSSWQEEGQKKKAKELLKEFYQSFISSPPKTLFLEKDFNLKIVADKKSYTFKGKIDRIDAIDPSTVGAQDLVPLQEEGTKDRLTVELIDYKTGKTRDLDTQDKRQLLMYQLAAKEVLGLEPVKLSYYYLEENKKVSFLGDEKALEDLRGELVEIVEKMKVSDFHATPSVMACKYCDFRDICEYRIS